MFQTAIGNSNYIDQPGQSGSTLPRMVLPPTPALIARIPSDVIEDRNLANGSLWAPLVLLFDELDLLTTDIWLQHRDSLDQVIVRSLNHWVQLQTGSLQNIYAEVQIDGLKDDCSIFNISSIAAARGISDTPSTLVFTLVGGDFGPRYLERKMTLLDSRVPKLAQTILSDLMKATWKSVPFFLPESVLDAASFLYWQGEDSEASVIGEWRSDGMSDEEIESNNLWTRSMLEERIPAAVLSPVSTYTDMELRALLPRHTSEVAEVIRTLLEIREQSGHRFSFFEADGLEQEIVAVGGCLRWHQSDHALRIYDDLMQSFWETGEGYIDIMGIEFMELTVTAMRETLSHWEKGFALLRSIDRLITLISDPANDSKEQHDNSEERDERHNA